MKYILTILACCLMVACKTTEKQTEIVTVHDTLKVVNVKRDSIYLKDSVFVNQYQRGDTIFQIRDRWHTSYVDKVKIDTIIQIRDSIVYRDREYVVEKKQPAIFKKIKFIVIGILLLFFCGWLWKATK